MTPQIPDFFVHEEKTAWACSSQMTELRNKMMRWPLEPGRNTCTQDVDKWIASSFMQNYRLR